MPRFRETGIKYLMILKRFENDREFAPLSDISPISHASKQTRSALKWFSKTGTRPYPERVSALAEVVKELKIDKIARSVTDRAFEISEGIRLNPDTPGRGLDPKPPVLAPADLFDMLNGSFENRRWLEDTFHRYAIRFHIPPPPKPFHPAASADRILSHLFNHVSVWEADDFPLAAMASLKNRYGWTFKSDAWSLREQIRREAKIVSKAWESLFNMAESGPLFVILNERTPVDYMTAHLPVNACIVNTVSGKPVVHHPYTDQIPPNPLTAKTAKTPILLFTGLKVSSSEHRDRLENTSEGPVLETAVSFARSLNRRIVFFDFSRRRFPRSFLRVFRFAQYKKWGIRPEGKVFDSKMDMVPGPKSPRGFAPLPGNPSITLFDPWPVSDPEIKSHFSDAEKEIFCGTPRTKPWQDDRIGGRTEMEMGPDGGYRVVFEPFILPTLDGWMRTDHLFQSRLSRFIRLSDQSATVKSP